MRRRYNAAAASSGAASAPVMQEACRAALQFAARFNAFALSGGALAALTRAWQAAVEVAFTKRWVWDLVCLESSGVHQPSLKQTLPQTLAHAAASSAY